MRAEMDGIGVLGRSRKWLEIELVRENDGVGGIEAEGTDEFARENKEVVRRRTAGGAGTHPKRVTAIAVSEGTGGQVASSTSMTESCSDADLSDATAVKIERREVTCEGD